MKGAQHISEIKDTKNGVGMVYLIVNGNNPIIARTAGTNQNKMTKLSKFIENFTNGTVEKGTNLNAEVVNFLSSTDKKINSANQSQYQTYCDLYPILITLNDENLKTAVETSGLKYKTLIGNRVPMFKKAIALNIDYTKFKGFRALDRANKAVTKGHAEVTDKGTVVENQEAIETAKSTAKEQRIANNEQLFKNKSFIDMMKYATEHGITNEMIISAVKSYEAPIAA